MEAVCMARKTDWGDGDGFHTVTGSFSSSLGNSVTNETYQSFGKGL